MPILPPSATAPYAKAEDVLNLVRSICNDAALTIAGNLISDDKPYTFVLLNAGYRYVQDELANSGYETLIKDNFILANVTPVPATALNPATQAFIDFSNYFDGDSYNLAPLLPQDLLIPLRLWERPAASAASFIPMVQANDGLPSRPQWSWLGQWEWRDDKLWFVGATQALDLRLRYQAYFDDLVDGDSVVRIFRGQNAVAYACAAMFAEARGSPLAASFTDKSQEAINQILTRTARKNQHSNHRRISYSRRAHAGWGGS